MRIPILVRLTDAERTAAVRQFNDLNAPEIVEQASNRQLRAFMVKLTVALKVAKQHPEDEDCLRLLETVRSVSDSPMIDTPVGDHDPD